MSSEEEVAGNLDSHSDEDDYNEVINNDDHNSNEDDIIGDDIIHDDGVSEYLSDSNIGPANQTRFRRATGFTAWEIQGLEWHNKYRSRHRAPALKLDRKVGLLGQKNQRRLLKKSRI